MLNSDEDVSQLSGINTLFSKPRESCSHDAMRNKSIYSKVDIRKTISKNNYYHKLYLYMQALCTVQNPVLQIIIALPFANNIFEQLLYVS